MLLRAHYFLTRALRTSFFDFGTIDVIVLIETIKYRSTISKQFQLFHLRLERRGITTLISTLEIKEIYVHTYIYIYYSHLRGNNKIRLETFKLMEARNDKKESLEERRGKHLPSCRTTRNETRKGTRQKNNFSCRQRISNCWEDCLLASDECGLPAPSPSRADTWRSPCNLPRQNPGTPCARSIRILKNHKNLSIVEKKKFSTPSVVEFMEDIPMLVENITVIKNKKRNLLSQCMDRLSSSRLRQTLQNFLL